MPWAISPMYAAASDIFWEILVHSTGIVSCNCDVNFGSIDQKWEKSSMFHICNHIARNHAHAKIAHYSMRRIIRAWEAWGHRPNDCQVLMMHWAGKCADSTLAGVLTFIPRTVKYIKAAMQKSCIKNTTFLHEFFLGHGIKLMVLMKLRFYSYNYGLMLLYIIMKCFQ